MSDPNDDHDGGLHHDLQRIAAQAVARRKALIWLAGAGAAAVVVGSSGSFGRVGANESSASAGNNLITVPETAGPFPGDGTNRSKGPTSNVLTSSGVVRDDIRPSFVGSTAVAEGVPVVLTLTVMNVNNANVPLAGHAVYLWHCDRDGSYSLYDKPAESYLRGVQVTDDVGRVTFTTIFPGCYAGRFPHMHFEVFSSLAAATRGTAALLTSQLAMPSAVSSTIYAGGSGYSTSRRQFGSASVTRDFVFRDNTAAQIAAMTPAMSGSVAAGYTGTAVVGLAL